MITPKDIHSKDFKKAIRGYDMDDVDQFLDLIIKDMETLYKENASLREECDKSAKKLDQYNEMETNLNRALILAEKTAENVKAEAILEKDRLLVEAREKAAEILIKAQEDAKNFNTVNYELVEKSEKFKNNLISLFEGQITSLKESGTIYDVLNFKNELYAKIQDDEKTLTSDVNSIAIEDPESKENLEEDFSLDYEEKIEDALLEEEEEFKNKVFRFLDK